MASVTKVKWMNPIESPNRIIMLPPVFLFVLASLFLFTAGCKKKTAPPTAEAESIAPLETSPVNEKVLDGNVLRQAMVVRSEFSGFSGPEIKVLIEHSLEASGHVIAFQNLRIAEASTGSVILRLSEGHDMGDMTHGVLMKPKHFMTHQSTAVDTSIPLYFQYPPSEGRVIKRLKGSLTVISAEKTETHTIKNLQAFIRNSSQLPEISAEIVKGFVLPPAFEGGLESFALTFNNDILVTDAKLLDRNQKVVSGVWPIVEVLPDGQSRILIEQHKSPVDEDTNLQFELNSKLISRRIEFDLADLAIPEVEGFESERENQYPPGESIPKNIQRGLIVQAHTVRSFFPLELSIDGTQPDHPVEIRVEVFGETTPDTVAVGNLKIDELQTDTGSLIPVSGDYGFFNKLQSGMHLYTPYEHSDRPPVEGVIVSYQFDPPASSIKSIEEFSGELTLVTAKSHEYLSIDNIMESLGESIQHPKLKELGIVLSPVLFGDGINISLDPKNAFQISEISALDASGGTSTSIYSGRQQFGEKTVFSFHAQDKLPPVIPVRIRINHGLEEMRIPFEFKGLPIPELIKADEN